MKVVIHCFDSITLVNGANVWRKEIIERLVNISGPHVIE